MSHQESIVNRKPRRLSQLVFVTDSTIETHDVGDPNVAEKLLQECKALGIHTFRLGHIQYVFV